MTHSDGSPYSVAERREIVKQARATARELLGLLELLAMPNGGGDETEVVYGERTPADEYNSGGIPGPDG